MEIEHDSVDCTISLKGECQWGVYGVRWSCHQAGANAGDCVPRHQKWERDLSARIILRREKVQADSSTESVTLDFLTGWEDEERQMPLKEEIKTPERNVKSLIVPRSRHLLVWVDLYTGGKKKGQPFFFGIKTQPGFSRDFISKSSLDAEATAHQWLRQSLWNISWVFSTFAVVIYSEARHAKKCKVTGVFISYFKPLSLMHCTPEFI